MDIEYYCMNILISIIISFYKSIENNLIDINKAESVQNTSFIAFLQLPPFLNLLRVCTNRLARTYFFILTLLYNKQKLNGFWIMNMDNLFKCDCSKYKLKRAYESIYNFVSNNLHNSEYENILKSVETLKNVKQKHYVLELYDPIYKSLESYCFSLYKDDTGYYTVYNNRIKHFHKMENAIKYQCSKHIVNSKLSVENFNYICLENSCIDKKESFKEYINRSYSIKKRIFI